MKTNRFLIAAVFVSTLALLLSAASAHPGHEHESADQASASLRVARSPKYFCARWLSSAGKKALTSEQPARSAAKSAANCVLRDAVRDGEI